MYLSGLLAELSFNHTVQRAVFLPQQNLKQLIFSQWIFTRSTSLFGVSEGKSTDLLA